MKTFFNSALPIWILVLLSTFALPSASFAQDEEAPVEETPADEPSGRKKISGGYGYFTAGYSMYKLDNFNTYFADQAFVPVKDNGISTGGGGMLFVKNFVLGGEGHGILTKRASSSLLNAQLSTGSGQFQMGYIVFAKKGLVVYPKLGIGRFNHELRLKEQISTTTLDTIVAGNYSGTLLSRKGTLGSVEACVDFMPGFDESSGGGLAFGLAVGYQMQLSDKGWDAYGTPVTGGPDVDLSGLYVRLRIGFGGWNQQ